MLDLLGHDQKLKPIERYALKFLELSGNNLLVLAEEKQVTLYVYLY